MIQKKFQTTNIKNDNNYEICKHNYSLLKQEIGSCIFNDRFARIITYSPIKKEEIFFKLNSRNEKLGFLCRYICSVAHQVKVPDIYIKDYIRYKKIFREYKKIHTNEKKSILKNFFDKNDKEDKKFEINIELQSKTAMLLQAILENIDRLNQRKEKLDEILQL